MLKLLRTDLDSYSPEQMAEDLLLLPEWRREKALSYKFRQGQVESILAFRLLQQGLQQMGIEADMRTLEVVENEHGKPSLKDWPETHFNLSHCKSAVACVMDSAPVGVDVEDRGRYSETLARHCMSEQEMERILTAEDADLQFTMLWTRKEALYKLLGSGITDDIRGCLENTEGIGIETEIHDKFILSIAKRT